MKLYHSYILRKVALALAASVIVCSLCLAVMSLIKLGNDRYLAIPPVLVLILLAYYNVFLSIYSVPISMLIACLLVFGRLSADNELMALRASGIAPIRAFSTVLGLSVVASFLMLWLNGWAAPRSHAALADLRTSAFSLDAFFSPGRTVRVKNYTIVVGARRGDVLDDVSITERAADGRTTRVDAKHGQFVDRRAEGKVQLDLYDVEFNITEVIEQPADGGSPDALSADAPSTAAGHESPGTTTTRRLMDETAKLYQIIFDFEDIRSLHTGSTDKDDMTMRELLARRAVLLGRTDEREDDDTVQASAYLFEINKRFVFSLTPLVFTLLGVSLGVRVHRSERSLGSALAGMIALAYYLLIIGIEKGVTARTTVPSAVVWVPCVVFLAIGVALTVRVNRGR
ncbi:MAG: LptF/LptG family permease [Verrucomicrobia bacterium]|nr:LptF/LptG family permease [Verrucomicrobiota bacterium]